MTPCQLVADNDRLSDENAQLRADLAMSEAGAERATDDHGEVCKLLHATRTELANARAARAVAESAAAGLGTLLESTRADLATSQGEHMAERQRWTRDLATERVAHAETRKALTSSRAKYDCYKHSATQTVGVLRLGLESTRAELEGTRHNLEMAVTDGVAIVGLLESTRAELAKAEARVKKLEAKVKWSGPNG